MCTDSSFIEVALFNTQWRLHRRHKTKEYHQNWFEWLYCRALTVRSEIYILLSFDGGCGEYAASDQNIDFEVIENMVWASGSALWRWQRWYNHLLKLNHSTFQKVTKYALFYSSVIVLKISSVFFFLLLQQLEIHPCWICIWISKDMNIMIGETFMHLKASLFDHNHSLHLTSWSRFSSLIPPPPHNL